MYISGTLDARGFKQWKEVNKFVKKGSQALYILVPRMVMRENCIKTFVKGSKLQIYSRYLQSGTNSDLSDVSPVFWLADILIFWMAI